MLPLLQRLLRDRENGATLLIMGDGASNTSADAFASLPEAESGELQLIVWGMGKTQAQLDADRERGLRGTQQPLQERQLRAIAAAGDGYYQDLTADDADVAKVLRRIDRHYLISDDSARPWLDGGYVLLPVLMLIFLQWFRRGWVIRW